MKLLLIDGGNTAAKWRVCSGDDFNAESEGVIVYDAGLKGVQEWQSIDEVYVADVSGHFVGMLRSTVPSKVVIHEVTSVGYLLGVTNSYVESERLGVDRFLSAVEVYNQYQKACCVIDLGTAAKVDVVSAEGVHLGGYIVPGIALSKSALFSGTGKVRFTEDELGVDSVSYGQDTASAVSNGCLLLISAWIDSVAKRFYDEFPGGVVVVAGGDALALQPFINERHEMAKGLVLSALIRIAKLAQK